MATLVVELPSHYKALASRVVAHPLFRAVLWTLAGFVALNFATELAFRVVRGVHSWVDARLRAAQERARRARENKAKRSRKAAARLRGVEAAAIHVAQVAARSADAAAESVSASTTRARAASQRKREVEEEAMRQLRERLAATERSHLEREVCAQRATVSFRLFSVTLTYS